MDRAAMDHLEQRIDEEVKKRFPGGAVQRVALLQYGDDPVIEPGELMVRVVLEAADGREAPGAGPPCVRGRARPRDQAVPARPGGQAPRGRAAGVPRQRRHRRWPPDIPRRQAPRLTGGPRSRGRRADPGDGPARRVDLETLDALITAGIAASRAEAVRWARGPDPRAARVRTAARAGPRDRKAQDGVLTPGPLAVHRPICDRRSGGAGRPAHPARPAHLARPDPCPGAEPAPPVSGWSPQAILPRPARLRRRAPTPAGPSRPGRR